MASAISILVPLDGSGLAAQALAYAQSLAGNSGRITLLQVVQRLPPELSVLDPELVPEHHTNVWMLKGAEQYLETAAAELRQTLPGDVDVVTRVSEGDPASAILRAASEQRTDLIVMTSHARGALGRAAYGSVADRVARSAAVPVVITRPADDISGERSLTIRRILLPLDHSAVSREAVPVASMLARRLGCSIHLIHVIDNFSSYMADTGVPIPQPLLDQWYPDAHHELEAVQSELRAEGIDATSAIYQGPTVANICEISAPGDLIVMTSHGRSGIFRWLIGSVAEKLVRTAPVPVCLVPARHRVPIGSEELMPQTVGTQLMPREAPGLEAYANDLGPLRK